MADELLQMFQSITTSDHDELIDQFAFLLELDHATATFFLESSNWNVEVAANNYLTAMADLETVDAGSGGRAMLDVDDDALYDDSRASDQQQQPNASDDLDMDAADNQTTQQLSAQFVSDLTQSQNTVLPPGAVVNMLWSFVNTSDVAWPEPTHLVFAQGECFSGPQVIPVRAAAHERIEIHAALSMPAAAGSYAGSWRLRGPHGFFGDPIWVILHVGPTASLTPETREPTQHDATKQPFVAHTRDEHSIATSVGHGNGASNHSNHSDLATPNDMEDMDL